MGKCAGERMRAHKKFHGMDRRNMMHLQLSFVLVAVATTSPAWCQGDFQWQGKLTAGQLIEIRSPQGFIHAEGTTDSTASVTAHKKGTLSDPAAVTIQVVPFSGGVVLCAMYPGSHHPNQCNPPGMDIYVSADNGNDVQVDFTVKVPKGVRLNAHINRGDIQATSLTGDVDVSTLTGEITLSTTGAGQATSLHGSVVASIGSVNWSGSRVFSSGEGNVDLQIPADANANVQVSAFRGTVTSDFSLTTNSATAGRFGVAQGTLGTGGRLLRVSAFDGNVILRKGPPSGH
jgi:hypothetical protein